MAIPATVGVLLWVRRYYDRQDAKLAPAPCFEAAETEPPTIVVAVEGRTRMSDRALAFAMTLSPDVLAVHLLQVEGPEQDEDVRALKASWRSQVEAPLERQGRAPPRLIVLPAPLRNLHGPLLELMEKLDVETPGRSVVVLIPELVLTRWWERSLHARRAEHLRGALLKHGGPRLNVMISPWRR